MERGSRTEVAVEEGLGPVAEALRRRGYHVTGLHPEALRTAAAVVVSGRDESLMGIQSIRTTAPVINAEGRSADEVVRDVEERLRLRT
ncbi:MAG: YkuS family protein [Firmicutes bacterium]|nr:YkuS family protein [Bacillota bacterium]